MTHHDGRRRGTARPAYAPCSNYRELARWWTGPGTPPVDDMSACPTLEVACLSDPGLKRAHNEDHAASDPGLGLVVIADGMGGYRSGEVASALAVQTIVRHVRLFQHQETGHVPPESTGLSPASRVLLDAIGSANTAVFQTGGGRPIARAWPRP